MYTLCLLLVLLFWLLSSAEEDIIIDLLQHPVVSSMFIAIRFPIIHNSPMYIISIIALFNQCHMI